MKRLACTLNSNKCAIQSYKKFYDAVTVLKAYWNENFSLYHPSHPLFPNKMLHNHPHFTYSAFKRATDRLLQPILNDIIDNNNYTSYSFRKGGVTDLWSAKTRPGTIKFYGGWQSWDTMWVYINQDHKLTGQEVSQAFTRISS